jgi:hypothetical protein
VPEIPEEIELKGVAVAVGLKSGVNSSPFFAILAEVWICHDGIRDRELEFGKAGLRHGTGRAHRDTVGIKVG